MPALGLRVRLSRASLRERPYVIDRGPGTITAVQKGGRCGVFFFKKKLCQNDCPEFFGAAPPTRGK